jgi:hypothetical protein
MGLDVEGAELATLNRPLGVLSGEVVPGEL